MTTNIMAVLHNFLQRPFRRKRFTSIYGAAGQHTCSLPWSRSRFTSATAARSRSPAPSSQWASDPARHFVFMLASVGTCLPTIAMATRIIGWRATVIYLVAWLLLAIGGGVLMGMWL
jgi:hypothetical protein